MKKIVIRKVPIYKKEIGTKILDSSWLTLFLASSVLEFPSSMDASMAQQQQQIRIHHPHGHHHYFNSTKGQFNFSPAHAHHQQTLQHHQHLTSHHQAYIKQENSNLNAFYDSFVMSNNQSISTKLIN